MFANIRFERNENMYLVNVDFPNETCTLHRRNCGRKPLKEPKYKGFGKMKRDGGWLSFETVEKAESHYNRKWQRQGYKWIRCSYCKP